MRHALLGLIIALLACAALWAQSPEPRFDVVSVKRSTSPEQGGRNALEPGRYVGLGVTLDQIAGEITAGRTVVNRNGLGGVYDIELRWTPDGTQPAGDDAPPTLVTALREQLELKLERETMMVNFLVMDGAERPREN